MAHGATDTARRRTAVGYLRRSTDRQEKSIPDQRQAVEQYAKEQGLQVHKHYVDDAISGTSTLGRKAFQQMMADAQKSGCRFSYVIVYDVKRFGRVDNDEAGYYRHLLRTSGVEVLYVSEGFSGADTDDLLRPVKQWQARQESKDLSKVTIRGLISRQPGGYWMGGVPPHGYDLLYQNDRGEFLFVVRHMPDGSKQLRDAAGADGKVVRTLARGESICISQRDRAKLVLGDPQRVAVVRHIFKMYTEEGKGLTVISNTLNVEGVTTPRGRAWSNIYSGKWSDGTIRAILMNPNYVGDMVWNRRTDGRFHRISKGQAVERKQIHGARLEPNAETDWMIVRDAHPVLISRRMFEQAKAIREGKPATMQQLGVRRKTTGGWTGARARFLLSGLIRCGRCGSRYHGVTRTKGKPRNDGTRVRTYYYGCSGYISKGRSVCEFGAIKQDVVEQLVIDAVLEFYRQYESEDGRKHLTGLIQDQLGTEAGEISASRERLLEEKGKIEQSIRNLLDNITSGTRDLVEQRLAELREERDTRSMHLDELECLAAEEREVQTTVQESLRFLNDLKFTLLEGVPEAQRTALRKCVSEMEVDRGSQRVTLFIHPAPTAALPDSARVMLRLHF